MENSICYNAERKNVANILNIAQHLLDILQLPNYNLKLEMSKKTFQKTFAIFLYLPILVIINLLAYKLLPSKGWVVLGSTSFARFPFPIFEFHYRLVEVLCLGTILSIIEFAIFAFLLLKNKIKPLSGSIAISAINFAIVMFFRYLEIQKITCSLLLLFFKSCYPYSF